MRWHRYCAFSSGFVPKGADNDNVQNYKHRFEIGWWIFSDRVSAILTLQSPSAFNL
jgi:hypothetical protein